MKMSVLNSISFTSRIGYLEPYNCMQINELQLVRKIKKVTNKLFTYESYITRFGIITRVNMPTNQL